MNIDYFKDLFAYSHHSNQKLADIFAKEEVEGKPLELFCHLLNAHHIWNARIAGEQPEFGVWDVYQAEKLKVIDGENYGNSLILMDKVEPDKTISYTTSKGGVFENKTIDILFHVINHSTYHRGQIALLFRQAGLEPLSTDYIFYKR